MKFYAYRQAWQSSLVDSLGRLRCYGLMGAANQWFSLCSNRTNIMAYLTVWCACHRFMINNQGWTQATMEKAVLTPRDCDLRKSD